MFFLASPTETSPTFTRRRVPEDTCARFCHDSVLAGAPSSATDKLQRVLNAAARLVSGTRNFDRGLSRLLHVDLHWLHVPERVHCAVQARRNSVTVSATQSPAVPD